MKNDRPLSVWITQSIKNFVDESPENKLGGDYNERAWETPLVGFSRGDDELYSFFKRDIGDFYWTPYDIFALTFPHIKVKAQELSVISWILPQTKATKDEQRKEKNFPTKRAVLARLNGDECNKKIGNFIIDILTKEGYKAVSPMLSPLWENKHSEKYNDASTWSERHTAYVSGLGTFGLSDGLITPVGKAMRCGSVIVKVDIEPTKRSYTNHNEYCLFYINGSCMKCAERCPAKAISHNGHDKDKCRDYQRNATSKHIEERYDINSRYCGICQFGVPCECKIPRV